MQNDFRYRLKEIVARLETENLKDNDPALQRIIQILKSIEHLDDLKKHQGLIKRIAIDGIKNWDITEAILGFTNDCAKAK